MSKKSEMPERRPAVSAEHSLLTLHLLLAIDYANRTHEWVVLVCNDVAQAQAVHSIVAGAVPPGSEGVGRTFLFPNRGRVSVAVMSEPLFVPPGVPFTVLFQGIPTAKDVAGMNNWRNRASRILGSGPTQLFAVT